ncbi:hypothetical protein OsI_21000 [Oryza sativa Indica Group]|uniref:Uncharacterized protein n=1 Tax=Oryza sativa subsp. indica TaxID=39946 RepID=A2Y7I2_ORYSI|nr:hypothetical protein OsI_21000 [Oryza sativa Indica Group]
MAVAACRLGSCSAPVERGGLVGGRDERDKKEIKMEEGGGWDHELWLRKKEWSCNVNTIC